jgi:hypothetical protein
MTTPMKSRRALRSAARVPAKSSAAKSSAIARIALSRPARTAYVVLGTAGLAALAVALIGPARLQREVIKPLRGAIEPGAEKLWADAKPLRNQIAGLFQSATPDGRARLVRSLQSWIGHFHAT